MKIEKLMIYGFGKHENITVDLGMGMNILYGSNEAGKTTIQQFILHILFGFPQRSQVNLRYEPKLGGKYGGQIQLIDTIYGRCTIERIGGKSAGDLTVYFEDGRKGGEEELQSILYQYDRPSFEAIFSFSLLQLQGFEKMDEEELSRTLLASGTTGVDSLLQLEKKMEKEMDALFKKSGRNPEMNVKISELRDLEDELKEEQIKVAEYAPSMERIHEINNTLSKLNEQEKKSQKRAQEISLKLQLLPLQQRKELLEERLSKLSQTKFPTNGIQRFESISGELAQTNATKQRIEEELKEMGARLPKQVENESSEEIEHLLAKESEWHGWRSALVSAADDLRRLEVQKRRLLDRLGMQGHEVNLFHADVSIQKEEEMFERIHAVSELDQQISFSDREQSNIEAEQDHIKINLDSLIQSAPSNEEQKKIIEWPAIHTQMAEAKAYIAFGKKESNKQNVGTLAVLLLIAIACMTWGIIRSEWLFGNLGLLLIAVVVFLYFSKKSVGKNRQKLQQMEDFLAKYGGKEEEMEHRISDYEDYQRKVKLLNEQLVALKKQEEAIRIQRESLDTKKEQMESFLAEFLQTYGFDGLPSKGIIPELFRMIRELQEIERNIEETTRQKSVFKRKIEERKEEVESRLQKSIPTEAIYEMLRKEFIRLNEVTEISKSLQSAMDRLKPKLKETMILSDTLQSNLSTLLQEANVKTDSEFYEAHNASQETLRLQQQLADTEAQLKVHESIHLETGITADELELQGSLNEAELSRVRSELDVLIHEKAALTNRTKELLTDETYGQKLQFFEMKKSELAELAKKWSENKAIVEAIRRIMADLKEKKLPDVLCSAEKIFSELTGGRYESFIVASNGFFEVVSENGIRYPIIELSQATKEQAYISLRLALADSLVGSAPFPIIMDDPFVHFDVERLSRMIEILRELQKGRQFIYFTCQKDMVERWRNVTTINVSKLGSEQGV